MGVLDLTREAPLERRSLLPLGAAALAVTLWASAFVGIRYAGRELSPGALTLGRLLVGSVVLGTFVLWCREALPSRRDLPAIVLVGLLWFGVYNVALNEAERRVDAGTAAMLVNIGPLLLAVLAGLALREGFPRRLLAGCLVAFTGVALIGVATSSRGLSVGWGVVLCFAAALAWAIAVIAQKPVLARVSGLQVTWLACTVGALACLPFAASLLREARAASPSTIAWAVYLGVGPTAIGFAAWAYALARTSAGRMGSTTYLVPPIAIVLGWALLAEVPPLLALPGGALCLAGVIIARRA